MSPLCLAVPYYCGWCRDFNTSPLTLATFKLHFINKEIGECTDEYSCGSTEASNIFLKSNGQQLLDLSMLQP